MEKLVEHEVAPPASSLTKAPALAVQFFLIPLAVVAVFVSVYAGFQMLLADERTASEYLAELRTGSRDRQWPAAFELSRLMADPAVQAREPQLGAALVDALKQSTGRDPRVRQYLAMAIGRLRPAPPAAVPVLIDATRDPDSETVLAAIWALGAIGDRAAAPRLMDLDGSQDAGVRKMAVYALGSLPGDEQMSTLQAALIDASVDVRWNAAAALARRGRSDAVPVVGQMLDRQYVERAVADARRGSQVPATAAGPEPQADPVDEVIISGLRAAAAVKDPRLRGPIDALSRTDRSLRVRQAAMEALKAI